MVQYRGKLMPLVADRPELPACATDGRQPILVFADSDRSMGLLVDEIVDIVEDTLDDRARRRSGPGLIGSAIIAGKATDIIDAGYYPDPGLRRLVRRRGRDEFGTGDEAKRVLLVDDSPFFRNLLTPLLSVAGYDVTTVESRRSRARPVRGGRGFRRHHQRYRDAGHERLRVRRARCARPAAGRRRRWWRCRRMPRPRISTAAAQVGFSDYVAKFDRDALLHTLSETLSHARGAA